MLTFSLIEKQVVIKPVLLLQDPFLDKIKNPAESVRIPRDLLEATTRFELVITVLQTDALPLGYVALQNAFAL